MQLSNYTLKISGKTLLSNTKIDFKTGSINHIVGKNGVGKSQLAKDFLLNNSGLIPVDVSSNVCIISSFSNVPEDLTTRYLLKLLSKKYNMKQVEELINMLNLNNIPMDIQIKSLSDGQKQKLKILSFFLEDKEIIILDEITNSLDKRTINEIYVFLNHYLENNKTKTIINITHNLSDLHHLAGEYYLFIEA